jgi:hypothetical protein
MENILIAVIVAVCAFLAVRHLLKGKCSCGAQNCNGKMKCK